jgi:hypothetical protein
MKTLFSSRSVRNILHHLIPNVGSILVMLAVLFIHDVRAAELNTGMSPSTISYQGTLSTASGVPVNSSVGLTFRIYNVQSGGTALWTEAHTGTNIVPVNNGLFNVQLGSIAPIPTSVWDNPTVYLGVQVEGDSVELSPREVVGAVPMAMMTSNITIPDGSVTTSKIADAAITNQKIQLGTYSNSITNEKTISTTSTTILTVPINVPYDATYLIVLNLSTVLDQAGTRAQIWIKDETGAGIQNYHIPHSVTGNDGTTSESYVKIYPFASGAHTITVTVSTTEGTGRVRGAEIQVIPFAQAITP